MKDTPKGPELEIVPYKEAPPALLKKVMENVIVQNSADHQETDGPSLVALIQRMRLSEENEVKIIGLIKHLLSGGVYKEYLDKNQLTWDALAAICYGRPSLWKAIDSAHYAARMQRLRRLESEAMRRALDGVEQPVFHQGEQVGSRKDYSDDLMKMLLKAHDPDTYADRQKVEHQGVMVNLNVEGVKRS